MTELDLFVPGRLCLFGEHSDWAGGYRRTDSTIAPGYCLAVGTTQGIYARVRRDSNMLSVDSHSVSAGIGSFSALMSPPDLEEAARQETFYAYCAGVAAHVSECYRVGGIAIQTAMMDLPLKRGLSSSAAICVLTARAFNQVYGLEMSLRDEMEAAYLGEIKTGSQCGRMDQVCAYGQAPVFLTFDGDQMDLQALKPHASLYLVIADLKHGKDTRKILHDLNSAFISDSAVGIGVRDALGTQNTRILRHARTALEAGNAREVGELMTEAQAIFDKQVARACPSELTAPRLHKVLEHPLVRELSWGGKGIGSQGDGCAQFVARDREAQQRLIHELPSLLDVNCLELTIVANGDER